MTAHDTDADWQRWGERDPYYGVITHDRYRRDKLTPAALERFFQSGESHVRRVLGTCRRHVRRGFRPTRVLDFGCGVGRLLVAFAQHAEAVVGVDVSPAMLDEARRNCEARQLANVTLLPSDDALSQVSGTFDLVHSMIVFQHIESERGCKLLARLLECLRPGGIAWIHLAYAKAEHAKTLGQPPVPRGGERLGWRERLLGRRTPPPAPPADGDPSMLMNSYPLNQVLYLVQTSGVRACHVEFFDHRGEMAVALCFEKPGATAALGAASG